MVNLFFNLRKSNKVSGFIDSDKFTFLTLKIFALISQNFQHLIGFLRWKYFNSKPTKGVTYGSDFWQRIFPFFTTTMGVINWNCFDNLLHSNENTGGWSKADKVGWSNVTTERLILEARETGMIRHLAEPRWNTWWFIGGNWLEIAQEARRSWSNARPSKIDNEDVAEFNTDNVSPWWFTFRCLLRFSLGKQLTFHWGDRKKAECGDFLNLQHCRIFHRRAVSLTTKHSTILEFWFSILEAWHAEWRWSACRSELVTHVVEISLTGGVASMGHEQEVHRLKWGVNVQEE